MDPKAMAPHGIALLDYLEGRADAEVTIRRDDDFADDVPASFFFRDPVAEAPLDRAALERCRAPVLDVGAGAGIHALALEARGLEVTAIDVCPEAVEVMRRRGLRDARVADAFDFASGQYASILMLGHGVGVAGTLDGLDRLLLHLRGLLLDGGEILCDSIDGRQPTEPEHAAYQAANREAGRYVGECRIRVEYGERIGPWTEWVHVDPDTLSEHAERAGYSLSVVHRLVDGNYLARLRPR